MDSAYGRYLAAKQHVIVEGDRFVDHDFMLSTLRDRARPYGYDVIPIGSRSRELTDGKDASPERRIQAAHDAVEDAQSAASVWRRRSAITAGSAAVGVALTLGGALLMWLGAWPIAIPVILIGLTAAVVGGIATCSRFASGGGVDVQNAVRRAERRLRDALTASEDQS